MSKNKEKLINKLVEEKQKVNNTIDLDAYANGLSDMWEVLKNFIEEIKNE